MPPMHGNAKLLKFISALLISIFLYSNLCDLDVSFLIYTRIPKGLTIMLVFLGKNNSLLEAE